MKKTSFEFKVGLFVVVGGVLLAGLVIQTGHFYLKPGYRVRFVFNSVSGVDTGSPVRLAGVTIGEVKELQVVKNAEGVIQAEVHAWIRGDVSIAEDAAPRIATIGFLGEKYIDILAGTAGANNVGDGGVLVGRGSSGMEEVLASGKRLIDKMDYAMGHVNEVVGQTEFKSAFKGTFVNGEKVAKNFMEASEDMKDVAKSAKIILARMQDGEGTVGKLLKEDKIAKDLEAFVADIKAHPWKLLKKS